MFCYDWKMAEKNTNLENARSDYISVVVNFKSLRFMTLVNANCLISDLIKEVENTFEKLYAVKVTIKTLKNSLYAVLPEWYPVAPLIKNEAEIFAFIENTAELLNLTLTRNGNIFTNTATPHNGTSPSNSGALVDSGFTSPLVKVGTSRKPGEDMRPPGQLGINKDRGESMGHQLNRPDENLSQDELLSEIFSLKDHKEVPNKKDVQVESAKKKTGLRKNNTDNANDSDSLLEAGRGKVEGTKTSEKTMNSNQETEPMTKLAQKKIDKSNDDSDSSSDSDESNLEPDRSAKEITQKLNIQRKNTSSKTKMISGQANPVPGAVEMDTSDDDGRMHVDKKAETKNEKAKTKNTDKSKYSLEKNKDSSQVSVQKKMTLTDENMDVDMDKEKPKTENRKSPENSAEAIIKPGTLSVDQGGEEQSSSDDESTTQEDKTKSDAKVEMPGSNTEEQTRKYDVKNVSKVGKTDTRKLYTKSESETRKGQSNEMEDDSSSDSSSSSSETDSDENETAKKPKDDTEKQQGSSFNNEKVSKDGEKVKDTRLDEDSRNTSKKVEKQQEDPFKQKDNASKNKTNKSPKDTAKKTENIQEKSGGKESLKQEKIDSVSESSWSSSDDGDTKTANSKTLNNKSGTARLDNDKCQTDAIDGPKSKDRASKNTTKPTRQNSCLKIKIKSKTAKRKGDVKSEIEAKSDEDAKSSVSTLKAPFTQLPAKTKLKSKDDSQSESESESDDDNVVKNAGEVSKDEKKKGKENAADDKTGQVGTAPADQENPNDHNTSIMLPCTPSKSRSRKSSAYLSASKVASWLLSNPVADEEAEITGSEMKTPQKAKTPRSKNKTRTTTTNKETTVEKIETKALHLTKEASQSVKRKLDEESEQEPSNKPKNKKKKSDVKKQEKRLDEETQEDKQEEASAKGPVTSHKGKNSSLSLPKVSKGLLALLEDESDHSTRNRTRKTKKQKHAPPTINRRIKSTGFLTPSNSVERKSLGSKSTKSRIKKIPSSEPSKPIEMNANEKQFLDSGGVNLETLLNDESIKW